MAEFKEIYSQTYTWQKIVQSFFKIFAMKNGNNHVTYYIRAFFKREIPKFLLSIMEKQLLKAFEKMDKVYVMDRVNYYNQLKGCNELPIEGSRQLSEHTYSNRRGNSTYFFDTYEYTRFFPNTFRWFDEPGDVNWLCNSPTVVKTRPLLVNDSKFTNSVILNLDKVRHFFFINDPVPFKKKKKEVLFRGDVFGKPKRIDFLKRFINEPGFDVGDTSYKVDPALEKNKMTKREHLDYAYIMVLEGNDVATSLKWVMSSNSIAVMHKPTCESWFMEGRLIPNYHYIEIKDDFSDISERIAYYNEHEDEAMAIIEHAHEWVEQFEDKKREDVISYLVMKKYFQHTSFNGKVQLE